jgi:uncharacterized membrane protein
MGIKNQDLILRLILEADEVPTFGQRAADSIAQVVGSWTFIVVQSIVMAIWIVIHAVAMVKGWDPYPFILLNLILSLQAAYTGPVLLMSQNRQGAKDRAVLHDIYRILKALDDRTSLRPPPGVGGTLLANLKSRSSDPGSDPPA